MKATAIFCTTLLIATSAAAQESTLGKDMFEQYCATCHGTDAKGDGPLTYNMANEVPALTGLSAANDGQFPLLDVIQTIDGRSGVRGHGGPMPIYGGLFQNELEPLIGRMGAEAIVRGRVLAIAEYISGLQE